MKTFLEATKHGPVVGELHCACALFCTSSSGGATLARWGPATSTNFVKSHVHHYCSVYCVFDPLPQWSRPRWRARLASPLLFNHGSIFFLSFLLKVTYCDTNIHHLTATNLVNQHTAHLICHPTASPLALAATSRYPTGKYHRAN